MAQADEIGPGSATRPAGRLTGPSRAAMAALVFLITMTGTAIALDMIAWKGRKAQEIKTFQKALGGLGMGAIATPLWQFINYDGRVLCVDDSMTWPVPGGYCYGPDRTGAVSYFEEIAEAQWTIRRR